VYYIGYPQQKQSKAARKGYDLPLEAKKIVAPGIVKR
jgi:hypothetical protein